MEKPLDLIVKDILEARRGEWQAISEEANVSHSWLSKFVNGHIPNPGLATLRKVYEAAEPRA
jgi:transcriptional regulator with XRE-family HTH domain